MMCLLQVPLAINWPESRQCRVINTTVDFREFPHLLCTTSLITNIFGSVRHQQLALSDAQWLVIH